MNTIFIKWAGISLLSITLLSSCSRPVAYFQKSPTQTFSVSKPSDDDRAAVEPVQPVPASTESLVHLHKTFDQVEAYVRADKQLATNQKLHKRMIRVTNLLASTHETLGSRTAPASHKMTVVDRLMLKKVNKQISRQLATNQPEKALVNQTKLIAGIILLLGGLALLIFGTGTVAFIGLIVALIGALGTLVGLLGIDSY